MAAASGYQLGTAWIQIAPSLKGFHKEVSRQMGDLGAGKASNKASGVITGALGGAFKTVTKVGAGALGGLGAAVTGLAATGGISRALAIEDARAKLSGIGMDAEGVDKVMQNALNSVKGTAYGLGDAATVAASLSASGVQAGSDLEGALKTVADTAQISGRSLTDVGAIFGSVAARGKLQGDDLLQLTSSGVPVLAMLGKHLGKTSEEISTMVSKGQIDFETFNAAMQEGIGGAALKAGDTFKGAWSNIKAALGRLGEGAATPILNALRDSFNKLIPVVDAVATQAGPLFEQFGTIVGDTAGKITSLITGIVDGSSSVDWSWVTALKDGVVDLAQGGFAVLKPVISEAWNVLQTLVPVVGRVLGKIMSLSGAVMRNKTAMSILAGVAGTLAGAIGGLKLGRAIGEFYKLQKAVMLARLAKIKDTAQTVILNSMYAGSWVKQHALAFADLARKMAVATATKVKDIAVLAAQKGAMVASTVATKGAAIAQRALNLAMKANPIGLVITAITALIGALVWFFTQTEVGKKAWAAITKAFQDFIAWIGPAWQSLWDGISGVWTAFTTWISDTWNAFTAWLGEAWNSFWTGISNFFSGLWEGIKTVFFTVWEFIKTLVVGYWTFIFTTAQTIWNGLVSFFTTLWDGVKLVFSTVWQWIVDLVTGVWNGIVETATAIWNGLAGFFTALWEGIKTAAKAAWDYFSTGLSIVWNAIIDTGKNLWNGFLTFFKNLWEGLKTAASTAANWVKDKVTGAFNSLKDGAIKAFQFMKDGIGKVWDSLKEIAAKPVRFVVNTVYNDGLRSLVNSVADKLSLPASLRLPQIRLGFAGGGVLPGYAPGRDTVPALLSKGEAVLVPELVRAIGPRNILAANYAYSGRRPGGGARFAGGGIVGWFKDKAAGVMDFLSDPLGAVADLITAPVRKLLSGVGDSFFAKAGAGAVEKLLGAIPAFFKGQSEKITPPGGAGLVSAAMRAVRAGIPYVWGGSTTAGLDCSGLVYWAAQQLGLGWPRLTAAGYQSGSRMGGAPAPGRLLFWGNPAWHVAIAAGNGMMIEEPRPGLSARFTSIWGNPSVGTYGGGGGQRSLTSRAMGWAENLLHTYDSGGLLMPGLTVAMNGTGKPETIRTFEQEKALQNRRGDTFNVNVSFHADDLRRYADVADFFDRGLRPAVRDAIGV
nr:MAG TPA: Minor tail protein [Caudoviricetes sp.]